MPQIEIKDVSYHYPVKDERSVWAVRKVSLCIEKGDYIALVGMNGSGKSTLAKLLNGLFLPDAGEILIDGISTNDDDNIFEIRKRVGMVFQNPDNQTVATIVEDDVAFGPENLGIPREEIIKRVDDALEAVGMSEYRSRSASRLSGGQKQRVAIAGVLAMRPEIIILDEATSMLDPSGRKEVLDVVKKLNDEGITVINITHNMEEAALADRIIVMRKSRVVIDGAPEDVFRSGQLDACGLTLPPLAQLAKRLGESGFEFSKTVLSLNGLSEEICRQLK